MEEKVPDILIENASQLLTMKGKSEPVKGDGFKEIGVIENGFVAVKDGKILTFGKDYEKNSLKITSDTAVINAKDMVVMPGFVDPHTHLAFAGTREEEFLARQRGESYEEIEQHGGGILQTIRATRVASDERLKRLTDKNIAKLARWGTTTVEIKSGYGLNTEEEVKILKAIKASKEEGLINVVATFMGAHIIPPEYAHRRKKYVDLIIKDILPMVKVNELAKFNDVFFETTAFDENETKIIIEKGEALGLRGKIHIDEFNDNNGALLAANLKVISAEHLLHSNSKGLEKMADSGVVPVLLPTTVISLGLSKFANARKMIEMNLPVALGTDYNPGTSMCPSMPIVIAFAVIYMKMTVEEALYASTVNAACAIGEEKNIGSIAEGKKADLIILDINSYKEIPYRFGDNFVLFVISNGNIIKAPREFSA